MSVASALHSTNYLLKIGFIVNLWHIGSYLKTKYRSVMNVFRLLYRWGISEIQITQQAINLCVYKYPFWVKYGE